MRLTVNGKLVGLGIGLMVGLLFIILGWKAFLILLGFLMMGLLLGAWADSREHLKRRLRQYFDRTLRL
jgi:uncharacterized membrane protein